MPGSGSTLACLMIYSLVKDLGQPNRWPGLRRQLPQIDKFRLTLDPLKTLR